MKIEKWFNELKEKHPEWSDIITFNTCLTGKSRCKSEVGKAFRKLVDKNEYERKDKEKIINFVYSLFKKSKKG